jgi:SAM-dependent methyltransferase
VRPTISYGPGIPDDSELRLCGDVHGKRIVELGAGGLAAAVFAARGAKAIALDPDATALDAARARAAELSEPGEELRVECHQGDFADLGFATSASVDLVFSAVALGAVDDLARVLRQVHRVLRAGGLFVFSVPHPVTTLMAGSGRYGDGARTVSDLFMALVRANFAVEVLAEPMAAGNGRTPPFLVVRARKLGV